MIRVRWMRQRCFPHIGMFSFLHNECINLHEGRLRNKMNLHSTMFGCFFVLKDFDQSQELKTISQSEVSTDNRKVSTFFASQHVRLPLLLSFLSGPFLNSLGGNSVCLFTDFFSASD